MPTRRLVEPFGPLGSPLTRRGFLRGVSLTGLALGSPGLLAACGTEGAQQTAGSCVSTDVSSSEKVINFSNWIGYVDPVKRKDTSTLEKFQAETGITVNYDTDVNDNNTFFSKVSPQLRDCKPTGRDVFVLTDWMAARMIELGWIQKLDHANLPNVDANMLDVLKAPGWDPNRDYSVPWQSGMTGICYNAELTDPVSSFEELMTRPDLKGKVDLLTEMRDTMGFMLLMNGSDPEDFTDAEFDEAIELLQGFVSDGRIRRFAGNDYVDDMKSGNTVACEAWSGDVINILGGGKFKYVQPEEGFMVWTDNMLVPNKASHKTNVEMLMNFYYDPVNAAKLAAWNYYLCPVAGAQQEIAQFDDTAVNSPFIFLDDAASAKGFAFQAMSESTANAYQAKFNNVMAG